MARFNEMQVVTSGVNYTPVSYSRTLFAMTTSSSSFWAFFMAQEAATITHLGLSFDTKAGTPPVQRVSLQAPTADGLASGALLATKTFQPPADTSWDNTFQWIELANPYAVSRGQQLVMVLEYVSGTVGTSNRSRYFSSVGGSRSGYPHFPYHILNNGVNVRSGNAPVFGYKSSQRSYGLPLLTISEETINSPAEVGMRFLFDKGFGSSYKILGASWMGKLAASGNQDLDLVLYGPDNAEIHRVTHDCDHAASTTVSDEIVDAYFDDATLEMLEFGKEYFLVLAPGGASTGSRIRTLDLGSASDMTALRGGSNLYMVSRATTTADWTRDRTRRPLFTDIFFRDWTV